MIFYPLCAVVVEISLSLSTSAWARSDGMNCDNVRVDLCGVVHNLNRYLQNHPEWYAISVGKRAIRSVQTDTEGIWESEGVHVIDLSSYQRKHDTSDPALTIPRQKMPWSKTRAPRKYIGPHQLCMFCRQRVRSKQLAVNCVRTRANAANTIPEQTVPKHTY